MRLIDADAIYKQVQEAEELAQDRVIDTKETLPFQSYINPAYTRYLAQVGERTWMKHMIANAPTVDAVPVRHGRWKEDTGGYGFWICSVCGFVSEASAANMLYKFCPHCGADMRKDGDNHG